jgi:hypothetical protein
MQVNRVAALGLLLPSLALEAPQSQAQPQPQPAEEDAASPAKDGAAGATTVRLGRPVELRRPPEGATAWAGACSLSHPVCVRMAPGTSRTLALAAIEATDRAWETLTGTLALPAPDGDVDGIWRVYLVDSAGSTAQPSRRDEVARFDRASSFGLVGRATPPGCALDHAVARAVARGSLWRSAPATDEGSAIAATEMLARLAVACSPDSGDEALFQAQPERTLVDPASPAFDRGATLFFEWLDARFGREPGALVAGLWALAPTSTPFDAPRWAGAPTGFDVLRVSLKDALWPGSSLEDVFVRFAVDRALALSAEAPRIAWDVPWPARARRLASPVPPAPTGASYVLVRTEGAPPGARLRLEAQWEDYGRMRWVVVKLGATGNALAELPIGSPPNATHASMTVVSLEGVSRVLVVGVNVGSTEHPFHPEQGEWEPHGWLLTLEGE